MEYSDTIVTWEGVPIEEMSREKMIECIRYLGREYHRHTTPEALHERALGSAEALRRGEKTFFG